MDISTQIEKADKQTNIINRFILGANRIVFLDLQYFLK